MSKSLELTVSELMETIDKAIEPSQMSASEALEVLSSLMDELDMRMDGLADDLKNE